MVDKVEENGVALAGGESATAHLYRALAAACSEFPDAFAEVDVGATAAGFRSSYPEVLPRFEAARAATPDRSRIARALVESAHEAVVWRDEAGGRPLVDHVATAANPFDLDAVDLPGTPGLFPRVPFAGVDRTGDRLAAAVRALVERGSASAAVADSVEWLISLAGSGGIDLRGRRIVMLGAGAELAPTRLWLEGGADVLWVDVADPPAELRSDTRLAGSLHWVPGGADLLVEPRRIRATVAAFADGRPVDVGLYAYAPGRAREWRLAAAMNAIVDALPAGVVRGVAMLVSPTTCGILSAAELEGEARRRRTRPRWQGALERGRLLGRGAGHVEHGPVATNRGIVSIQGGSYQAAQYLGKLMAAEAWATGDPPLFVSANTAGISLTESLHHPVFDTAFSGAGAFGIETFDPATTAHLNGLLTLRDRLDPAADSGVDGMFATRVHGGIYELPYPIEPALRVATAIGVARRPTRITSLLRRS